MIIPNRRSDFEYVTRWPQYIILHDTMCLGKTDSGLILDKSTFQTNKFSNYVYQVFQRSDTGFHFILDKVADDYQVVISQPILTRCKYEDMEEKYQDAVHISFLGDYNIEIPKNRLYSVLAFKLLSPLTRLFNLKEDRILFHSDISTEEGKVCPGENISMDRIQSYYSLLMRRQSLRRN